MATPRKKAASKKAAKKTSTSKAVVNWEERLAAEAEVAAKMEESSGGGEFFSLKNGILSWQDAQMPNNEMAVVICDSIFETIYYEDEYDPDSPAGPTAFALGRVQEELEWHENSREDFAGTLCSESEVCEWGSAERGKGKAARETRRLALIPAGRLDRDGEFTAFEDESDFNSSLAYMRLPVTSIRAYAGYVRQVSQTLKRPPFGVFTRIWLEPDDKDQFHVCFEALEAVPDDLMNKIFERHDEAKEAIMFPYAKYEEMEEEPKPKRGSRKAPAKKKAAKKSRRRY